MICPFCGHTLNFLAQVLALTQTGAQCPNSWNHLSHGACRQIPRFQGQCDWSRRHAFTGSPLRGRPVQVHENASRQKTEFSGASPSEQSPLETAREYGEVNLPHAKTSRRAVSQIATTPGWRSFRSAEIA